MRHSKYDNPYFNFPVLIFNYARSLYQHKEPRKTKMNPFIQSSGKMNHVHHGPLLSIFILCIQVKSCRQRKRLTVLSWIVNNTISMLSRSNEGFISYVLLAINIYGLQSTPIIFYLISCTFHIYSSFSEIRLIKCYQGQHDY